MQLTDERVHESMKVSRLAGGACVRIRASAALVQLYAAVVELGLDRIAVKCRASCARECALARVVTWTDHKLLL